MTGDTSAKTVFFVLSWTSWTRMPPGDQPEPANFDTDDVETDVQATEPQIIQKMIQVNSAAALVHRIAELHNSRIPYAWNNEKPLARLRSVHQAVHAVQNAPP
eukprot:2332666-Pleurochrysis_carterae.AAC.1